ncbi:Hypothetical protein CINCED_3A005670 [Cinara cedri]|nr:Hypothetical protein CINCED_3A005670 [Cinara cedri]
MQTFIFYLWQQLNRNYKMHSKIINDEDLINDSEIIINEETEEVHNTDNEEDQRSLVGFSTTNGTPNTDMVAESIIDISTNESGQEMCLVKWRGIDEPELIPASEAHVRCTRAVLQFYESRIVFPTVSSSFFNLRIRINTL